MKQSMRRVIALSSIVAASLGVTAQAGVYSDDLAKCLVSATTAKDQTDLVRWIFATAALHPEVGSIVSVSDAQRSDMTRAVGHMIERLLTDSCRAQFRDAAKYEGQQALELSFSVLGQVAMRSLMEHPAVAQGFGALDTIVSKEKLEAVVQSQAKAR